MNPDISPLLRNQAAQWLLDRAPELDIDSHTVQLAVTVLNLTLLRIKCPVGVLQLVVVTCLMIAVKFQEGKTMTLDQVLEQSGGKFSKAEAISTELYIMDKLEWTLAFPTAAELGRQLIYITGVDYNFSKILERSEVFQTICYADYAFGRFSPIVVAVVSVTFALEQYKQMQFRNQWLKLLNEKVKILNFGEVDSCRATLLQKLYRETAESDRSKLSLSDENLSSVVQSCMRTCV